MRRWLLGGLLLLSPVLLAAQWDTTTNYETKVISVVVRESQAEEALRQFVGDRTCVGVSDWTYHIYISRENTERKGHWVTDEKPRYFGKVKLCKGS